METVSHGLEPAQLTTSLPRLFHKI